METFREPHILGALQSSPTDRIISHGSGGSEPYARISLSDYYERMLWLLPDELCDILLSEWIQVIDAKRSSYEPFSNWWPSFLATYRISSRSYKPGKSKPRVEELSEALTQP